MTRMRTALKLITIGPLFMAGGILLGACAGGADSDEPVYPAGVAACVEGSKAMVEALGIEADWDRDLAVKECGG